MHLTSRTVLLLALVSLGSLVISAGATLLVLVRLPADYFSQERRERPRVGLLVFVAKNIAGWILIAVGIVLSIPGVPGQGLLTILLGVMLADFPGKYRLERWIVRRGPVWRGANAARARFGRPPFTPPYTPPPTPP